MFSLHIHSSYIVPTDKTPHYNFYRLLTISYPLLVSLCLQDRLVLPVVGEVVHEWSTVRRNGRGIPPDVDERLVFLIFPYLLYIISWKRHWAKTGIEKDGNIQDKTDDNAPVRVLWF